MTERDSYDAWGRRRNADGTDAACGAIASATTRGFTSHEMLDGICEINANARIYDPTIARILSANSTVPNPFNSQSFNRYSYVGNNPLSATDPSGYTYTTNPGIPCYGCWGPGIESDSAGRLVSNAAIAAYRRLNPSGGAIVFVDNSTGDVIGTCSSVSSCADLLGKNYSQVNSLTAINSSGGMAGLGAASLGISNTGTVASSDSGGFVTGSTTLRGPDSSGIETVVVTATGSNLQPDGDLEPQSLTTGVSTDQGLIQIADKGGRKGVPTCPGLGGQDCGATTPGGGVNPDYPGVCHDCLDRNRKWPFGNQPPPNSLKMSLFMTILLGAIMIALAPAGI